MKTSKIWMPLLIGLGVLAGGWIGGGSWLLGATLGSLAGGAAAGAVFWRNREDPPGESRPEREQEPSAALLAEQLEAARTEVEAQQVRLGRLEEASRDNALLLAEVAGIAAPLLGRMEGKLKTILDQGVFDRRGDGGELWRDLRTLSALMDDLPALARVDAEGAAPRPVPTDLRRTLAGMSDAGKFCQAEVDSSVPPLLFLDQILLGLALEGLVQEAGRGRRRPRLTARAEAKDFGLYRLDLELDPAPEFPAPLAERLDRGEAVSHPMSLLKGREGAVALAVALRAVAHLGGSMTTGMKEDQTTFLRMRFVFPEAVERRRVVRQEAEEAVRDLEAAGSLW